MVDADQVNVALTFVQSDFSEALDNDETKSVLKVRTVKLLAKGGFKINTSVALTLNNFLVEFERLFISAMTELSAQMPIIILCRT